MSKIFYIPELAMNVLSRLSEWDLMRALITNQNLWYMPSQSFFCTKVEQLLCDNLTVSHSTQNKNYRRMYIRLLNTIKHVKQGKTPRSDLRDIEFESDFGAIDYLCHQNPNFTLMFRAAGSDDIVNIYQLDDSVLHLLHKDQPSPSDPYLFAGGELFMGWEDDYMVIRKVEDWSIIKRFHKPDQSGWDVKEHTWFVHRNYIVHLHFQDSAAGTIEIYDSQGNSRHILKHEGMTSYSIDSNSDLFLTYSERSIKVWDLSKAMVYQYTISGIETATLRAGILGVITSQNMLFQVIGKNVQLPALNNNAARRLQGWKVFSDGRHLFRLENTFFIVSPDFKHFEQFSTDHVVEYTDIYLGRFVLGITHDSLVIWSETGEELIQKRRACNGGDFDCIWDTSGRVILFYCNLEDSCAYRKYELFDFRDDGLNN